MRRRSAAEPKRLASKGAGGSQEARLTGLGFTLSGVNVNAISSYASFNISTPLWHSRSESYLFPSVKVEEQWNSPDWASFERICHWHRLGTLTLFTSKEYEGKTVEIHCNHMADRIFQTSNRLFLFASSTLAHRERLLPWVVSHSCQSTHTAQKRSRPPRH